jgi:hypothetical protein
MFFERHPVAIIVVSIVLLRSTQAVANSRIVSGLQYLEISVRFHAYGVLDETRTIKRQIYCVYI